ncbi:MAG: alpha/beta hydrolase [Acidobacteriota bacterium]
MPTNPLQKVITGEVRAPLLILLGAVGLVLLIGCANVANLPLARAAARRREMAIRGALGASPVRIVRQVLAEGLLLALIGGTAGVLLAAWAMRFLIALIPSSVPRSHAIAIDPTVLLYSLLISVLTALIFGVAPSLGAAKVDLREAIQEGGRSGGASRGRRRLQSAFVVAQVALALVLLCGSGLLIRSFNALMSTDPGFKAAAVLTFSTSVPLSDYTETARVKAFYLQGIERLAALPGVRAVAACDCWPRAPIPAGFTQPVKSEVPALLLNRALDPVTGPEMARRAARHLPNSLVVIVPEGSHWFAGMTNYQCINTLMTKFVEQGSIKELDASCVATVKRVPFTLETPQLAVVRIPDTEMQKYAGRYKGENAPFEVGLDIVKDKLRLTMPDGSEMLLAPVSPTRFRLVGARRASPSTSNSTATQSSASPWQRAHPTSCRWCRPGSSRSRSVALTLMARGEKDASPVYIQLHRPDEIRSTVRQQPARGSTASPLTWRIELARIDR